MAAGIIGQYQSMPGHLEGTLPAPSYDLPLLGYFSRGLLGPSTPREASWHFTISLIYQTSWPMSERQPLAL